jgi:predicted transcriptional regulator
MSVRLPADIVAQLDELAEEMEPSLASLLSHAVREYVERELPAGWNFANFKSGSPGPVSLAETGPSEEE